VEEGIKIHMYFKREGEGKRKRAHILTLLGWKNGTVSGQ
jgi:hypothetical protein